VGAAHLIDRYHYRAGWCEGPEHYVAACAEFQGLTASGDTAERALSTLKAAVLDIVSGMRENGEEVPEPLPEERVKNALDDGPLNDCT
jgi:predicted RNase H-like HicB family nuclease